MFAFAVWNRATRELTLVRDRMGIKPLYWAQAGGQFLFASELKALRAHPDFRAEMDPAALAGYLRHAYVPSPRSIYRDAHKLPPGHLLTVSADRSEEHTSELQSLMRISYAVFCLNTQKTQN